MFGVQSYVEKLVKIVGIDLSQIQVPVKDLADQKDFLLRRKIYQC